MLVADDALAARLLSIFVEELGEQVQQLNEFLLIVERTPGDAESLGGVFRVMHTLKGAARAAGVLPVESLCHLLETDLAHARDAAVPLGGATIAVLFEAADALSDARDRLAIGGTLAAGPIDTVMEHARARGEQLLHGTQPAMLVPMLESAPATDVQPPGPLAPSSPLPATTGDTDATARTAPDQPRDELVRVGIHHVDAISNAAGEVTSLAAVLGERADELAALRQRVRAEGERPERRDDRMLVDIDRDITRLLRRASEDARTLGSVSGRLTSTARRIRQRSLRELTETLPRVARDVARDVAKDVQLVVTGEEVEADRVVVEALREPLLHLVRNAVDHGLESGPTRVAAGKSPQGTIAVAITLRGDRLRVAVTDDGRGLDPAAIGRALEARGRFVPSDSSALSHAIFDDGLSTREHATTLSGRGVGLGIVRASVERVGGTVEVQSRMGLGTTFILEVPLSIATVRALTVQVNGALFGIPSAFVARVDRIDPRRLSRVDGDAMLTSGGAPIPVTSLAALLGAPFEEPTMNVALQIVTLELADRRLGIVVDGLCDERELVLRPLEHAGHAAAALTIGTALLGNGDVVLVLGVGVLMASTAALASLSLPARNHFDPASRRILVVDDSITSRTLEQSVLSAAGYGVVTAVDGLEGWRIVERGDVALVVSDVEMPHLDGVGLCERIRSSERHRSLPVILVTSLDQPEQRARGLEAGADAYVTKSGFDQDILLETIRQLLGAPDGATS